MRKSSADCSLVLLIQLDISASSGCRRGSAEEGGDKALSVGGINSESPLILKISLFCHVAPSRHRPTIYQHSHEYPLPRRHVYFYQIHTSLTMRNRLVLPRTYKRAPILGRPEKGCGRGLV